MEKNQLSVIANYRESSISFSQFVQNSYGELQHEVIGEYKLNENKVFSNGTYELSEKILISIINNFSKIIIRNRKEL